MANQTARGTHVQQITCPPELQITTFERFYELPGATSNRFFVHILSYDIAQAGKYLEIFSVDPDDAHRPPGQVCSMIFSGVLTNQCIMTPKTV